VTYLAVVALARVIAMPCVPTGASEAAALTVANRLAEPQLKREVHLELVEQLSGMLNGKVPAPADKVTA
jgi:hypothetical protein